MTECDFLIVGHGLAGATLAEALRQRGQQVLVYDPGQPDSASNVAAGLMNPVTGQRFTLSWRAAELIPAAIAFYQELETRYGQSFFQAAPIFKIFASLAEQNAVLARSADQPWAGFVESISPTDPHLPGVVAPFGGLWLRGSGYLRVAAMLAALEADGLRAGWLRREAFDWTRLVGHAAGGATYAGQVRAAQVVSCEGPAGLDNPYFSWLPLRPNQGEVLDVDCAGLSAAQALNRGAYVVPDGPGRFRVGATYRWPPFTEFGPTPGGRAELSDRLAVITGLPFGVRGQRAGVRPATRDRMPLLGRHPTRPWLSFCGGYGSKGAMLAPQMAALLADHLTGRGALWPEVNLARFGNLFVPPAVEDLA